MPLVLAKSTAQWVEWHLAVDFDRMPATAGGCFSGVQLRLQLRQLRAERRLTAITTRSEAI
jgi:hypothetical protein